ncbi:marine proteobacterial sortase target protein [Shewanella sp. D64]|uniref:marine proteobacterial sortase target protein n=1 Tax=unclassified Shewanella TaxID=196818 RepID=UPI0022BA516E|nr:MULTISPECIES: marine proteobacterial sortase target protein [unclassified Shewanella]MEC4724337.1 marine proteobacterial sortase target protein [Shewanella sp. D64]MEC4738849.1 marine proteobacterial sortase target protein [Shewanella sp. E94]WBJ97714.1 marine proteobacterial sortase target protein [Shewanella sp. MTB7]
MKMDKQFLFKARDKNISVLSSVAPIWGATLRQKIVVGFLCCLSFTTYAEETDRPQASLVYKSINGEEQVSLPLNTQVQMKVSGWINRVKVRQEFRNDTDHWLNGDYQFPLPNEAAVDHMRLQIGSQVIEGKIQEKQAAKKQFEIAKKAGQRASLVAQSKTNIFTTSVANLGPSETLVVEIRYQELVSYKQGEFSLRFPMVVNPRYLSPMSELNVAELSAQTTLDKIEAYFDNNSRFSPRDTSLTPKVSIRVELNAGVSLERVSSPYHKVSQTQLSDSRYTVELVDTTANRDFVLNWIPQLSIEPVATVFSQTGQTYSPSDELSRIKSASAIKQEILEDDFALLMLLPRAVQQQDIMIPRELILVIDTSGSMSGGSIEQAKKALLFALAGLRVNDTFNVIEFNSKVDALSAQPLAATAKNIGRANQYVRALEAEGGTEMRLALKAALDVQHTEVNNKGRLRQVLFMTDGAVGDESALFYLIKQKIGDSRLFTLGIGSAPNSHFMQRAAEFGRGTFTYIGKLDEVQSKIEALLHQIERPQLTDIKLRYADNRVPDYWPAVIPDLYAEEPLLVAIKMNSLLHTASPSELVVSGTIAGQYWQKSVSLKEREPALGLDLLWARKQISALELSKDGVNEQRVKQQITALALNYHLVSAHTSLVAIELTPARHSSIVPKSATVLNAIPFGWTPSGSLPQTGTASRLFILMGCVLFSLLGIYLLSYQRAFGIAVYGRKGDLDV